MNQDILEFLKQNNVDYKLQNGVIRTTKQILYLYPSLSIEYLLVIVGSGEFLLFSDGVFDNDLFLGTLQVRLGCQYCASALKECEKLLKNRHNFIQIEVIDSPAPNFIDEDGKEYQGLKEIKQGISKLKKIL